MTNPIRPHETDEARAFVETLIRVPTDDLWMVLVAFSELSEGAEEHRPEAQKWLKALGAWIFTEIGHRRATERRVEIDLEGD